MMRRVGATLFTGLTRSFALVMHIATRARFRGGKKQEQGAFEGFDLGGLWKDCDYSRESYIEPAPSPLLIASVESELGGYILPAAYIELAQLQNGGVLQRDCYPLDEPTSWGEDEIGVTGILAIGRKSQLSLCGWMGSKFWEDLWDYPPIGIYFATTISSGHQMLALDYSLCGKQGEPRVVLVDQEDDYSITVVAPDFATFIRGLVVDKYNDPAERRSMEEQKVDVGRMSPILIRAFEAARDILPDAEARLRRLARSIVDEKGNFLLHADDRSHLMYGLMFLLFSRLRTAKSFEDFLKNQMDSNNYDHASFELMIVVCLVADPFEFRTGGIAPGFVESWWEGMVGRGEIVETAAGFKLTATAEDAIMRQFLQATETSGSKES